MTSPGSRRLPRALGWLAFSVAAWFLIAAVFFLVRFHGTGDLPDWATGTGPVILMVFAAGLILGALDWAGNFAVDHTALRAKPFWCLLIFKLVAFLLGIALVVLLGRLLAVSLGQLTWSNLAASYLEYLTSRRVMAGVVYLAAAALVMAFIRQTAAMVGPRVLANLMLGRYYHPREEELIFMFLDMKSSTSIAERLGHRKFSRLLQDCFRDLTDVALRHLVEIYKYVGDEAILTWRPQDGLTDSNCVATYFGFCEVLESRRSHYESAYGCFPEFKAGLNLGPVTVAEVGVLKREIAYLSDVLNTAARIQGMCNELESPILISGMLRKRLPEGAPYHYQSRGEISLRGREEQVGLFGVEGRRE